MIQKVHINSGIVGRLNPTEVKELALNTQIKDGKNINMPVMSLIPVTWIRDLISVHKKLTPVGAAACLEAVNAVPAPKCKLNEILYTTPARFQDKGKLTWAAPTIGDEINKYAFEVGKAFCDVLYPMAKTAKLSHLLPDQEEALNRIKTLTTERCYYVSIANRDGDHGSQLVE